MAPGTPHYTHTGTNRAVGSDSDAESEQLIAVEQGRAANITNLLQRRAGIVATVLLLGAAAAALALCFRGTNVATASSQLQQKWGFRGSPSFAPGVGHPHGPGGPWRKELGLPIDQDGNGEIDDSELKEFSDKAKAWFDVTEEKFQEEFEEADANADGKLDREEVKPLLHELWLAAGPNRTAPGSMHPWKIAPEAWMHHRHAMKAFEEVDRDGNGQLEGDELDKLAERLRKHFNVSDEAFQEALTAADMNGDGKLDKSEAPKLLKGLRMAFGANRRFEHMDHDGNGKVEGEELRELADRLAKHRGLSEEKFQQLLQAADLNGDGKLERNEMPALCREMHRGGNRGGPPGQVGQQGIPVPL